MHRQSRLYDTHIVYVWQNDKKLSIGQKYGVYAPLRNNRIDPGGARYNWKNKRYYFCQLGINIQLMSYPHMHIWQAKQLSMMCIYSFVVIKYKENMT